jgi:hypothetical protein
VHGGDGNEHHAQYADCSDCNFLAVGRETEADMFWPVSDLYDPYRICASMKEFKEVTRFLDGPAQCEVRTRHRILPEDWPEWYDIFRPRDRIPYRAMK